MTRDEILEIVATAGIWTGFGAYVFTIVFLLLAP
jgi:hypothetical protein